MGRFVGKMMVAGFLLALHSQAVASLGQTQLEVALFEAPISVDVKTHNPEAQATLNSILSDESYWSDAWKKSYSNKIYDEIRLKSTAAGYVPMITGDGKQDFRPEVVADTVFFKNTLLPQYMSGAKNIVFLGQGTDPATGAEYRDTYYVLDLTVFYGVFPQRMYRKTNETTGQTVLWFEKLEPEFVGAEKWASYNKIMKSTVDNMDKRWPPFNSVIEVTEIYGMFVVSKGEEHSTRVSFISKLTFGEEAGWMARMGSQLPGVLKAGLRSGFTASVQIAEGETKRRERASAQAQ